MHIIEADAAAVRYSVELLRKVDEADLARPTPCAGWDLRALREHMTAQHRGFAAAARGHGSDPAVWVPKDGDDYEEAADDVIAAFGAEGVLEKVFDLPEMSVGGARAVSFHLVDYVVHTWDAAVALGVRAEPPAEAVALGLHVARAVPDDDRVRGPGKAFARAREVPPGVSQLDEIVLLLGREIAS
jgi:uncharacterized protein (TIGR03086 family)